MSEKEYSATKWIGFPMMMSFIFFPAFCFITILFGYVWNGFIIMESIVGTVILVGFIFRTKFVFKYPQYATRKRLIFETTMYIACLIFAIVTGFLVKENNGVFSYYFLNIYIQPAYMIFTLVIMGLHISTDKKVAKAFNKEKQLRSNMTGKITVKLNYNKPYGLRYDCYYNNKKISKKDSISFAEEGEIILIERNVFLSKLWWILSVFNLLCGLFGSFDDWKNERVKQRKITICYKKVLSDNLTIDVLSEGTVINLKGVESYTIATITEEENPLIRKRISVSQKLLIIFPLIILAIVLVILAVC